MNKIIKYFCQRHLLTNFIFIGVIIAGIVSWTKIDKEELPDFESNYLRIAAPYLGASAEDIETLVIEPIEDELKTVQGISKISSTANVGLANINVEIDLEVDDSREVVQEIKDATDRADIPIEVRDDLTYRQFKTTQKAILDVALIDDNKEFLDYKNRFHLQKYVHLLEDRITNLPEVSSVDISGRLQRELQVIIDHKKLRQLQLPLSQIIKVLKLVHIVFPSGSLSNRDETKVSVIAKYQTPEKLENLVIRSNTSGVNVYLKQVATIKDGYEKLTAIRKVQGHEAIILRIQKSISSDILSARDAVFKLIDEIKPQALANNIRIIPMDDESFEVRNRLSIITMNGLLGFFLIVAILFLFLDFRSGLWVSAGIPFTLCLTIFIAYISGYTVNNMTLAAIIIVIGIVVDDAIIIAEYTLQLRQRGLSRMNAATQGATEMMKPITAAILTTCVAFVPLYFFSGWLGRFIKYMPLMIFAMLFASFFESLFILPSHLSIGTQHKTKSIHWFQSVENRYRGFIRTALKHRYAVIGIFSLLLLAAIGLFQAKMQFVLFPREEAKEVFLRVIAKDHLNRFELAKKISEVEDVLMQGYQNELVAVRTSIARSRRGGQVRENEAFIRIELLPKKERNKSLNTLISEWEKTLEPHKKDYEQLRFIKHRWGQASGSPIEIEIRENRDDIRNEIANSLKKYMETISSLKNVEIEEPLLKISYELHPVQNKLMMTGVDPEVLTTNTRAYLTGLEVYSFVEGDEEVKTMISLDPTAKSQIDQLKDLYIENTQGLLIPMKHYIDIKEVEKPISISRIDYKRTTNVFADMKDDAKMTPLEIADNVEQGFFKQMQIKYPSAILTFRGEIEDSRESSYDLIISIIILIGLIFAILVLLYNSIISPTVILTIVPFGLMGVVFTFLLHGMGQYGFMAAVGSLGMIGVVVNDAIIMVSRLDQVNLKSSTHALDDMAAIVTTRFRAILLTTVTTVAGIFPTAYGILGFDSMLSEMMLALGWGLIFGTLITLILTPCLYATLKRIR